MYFSFCMIFGRGSNHHHPLAFIILNSNKLLDKLLGKNPHFVLLHSPKNKPMVLFCFYYSIYAIPFPHKKKTRQRLSTRQILFGYLFSASYPTDSRMRALLPFAISTPGEGGEAEHSLINKLIFTPGLFFFEKI